MESNVQTRIVEQIINAIAELDLGPIKFKLMDRYEGQGWSRDHAEHMEQEYKRFLMLLAKYPHATLAPGKDVDKFWHGHILDTLKYADDCQHMFGHFLHHFPYFGMRGDEDAANLTAAGEATRQLYEREFGEPMHKDVIYCGVARDAYCGVAMAGPVPSYCGATVANTNAYCGVAKPVYCGAMVSSGDTKSVAPLTNASNAMPHLRTSATDTLKTELRPMLRPAS